MKNNNIILSVDNISLKYNHRTILENVSIEFPKNTITALLGPSGCGKSSFLLSLNGLIHSNPDACISSGTISFNGFSINENKLNSNTSSIRRKIGTIFQKPNPFPLSIYKNLELPLKEHFQLNKQEIKSIIEENLKEVGLWDEVKDRLQQSALSLSGGQQQRLCIARTLVLQPTILLMDEPCSALDPISTTTIEDLIVRLKQRCTIIIVTHNLAQAKRVADSAALFWLENQKGYIVEHSLNVDFFNQPQSKITSAYINCERC